MRPEASAAKCERASAHELEEILAQMPAAHRRAICGAREGRDEGLRSRQRPNPDFTREEFYYASVSPVWDPFVRLRKPLLNDDCAARRSICAFSAVEGMWAVRAYRVVLRRFDECDSQRV